MFVSRCECICMCVVSEGAQTRRLSSVYCRLDCGGRGKRDRPCYYDHVLWPPLWWRLDRMDGSCCWLSGSQGMLAMPTMPYYVAASGV